jgi:hypothetical protein
VDTLESRVMFRMAEREPNKRLQRGSIIASYVAAESQR